MTEFNAVVLGDRPGLVCIAYGRGPYRNDAGKYKHREWQEMRYAWPADRDRLIGDVAREVALGEPVDVYVCPAVRGSWAKSRRKGDALPPMVCWGDLDGDPADADLYRALVDLGGLVVLSGSHGNQHLYLPLTEPVDLGTHARLNKALADRLGGDAKWSDESLLRLPGTHNWKAAFPVVGDEPRPQQLVQVASYNGRRIAPAELAELLGVDLTVAGGTSTPAMAAPVTAEPAPAALPPAVQRALDNPDAADRSVACARVIAACADTGLTPGQALSVLADYGPAARYKTAKHMADDVARLYAKVTADRADRAQREADSWAQLGVDYTAVSARVLAQQGASPGDEHAGVIPSSSREVQPQSEFSSPAQPMRVARELMHPYWSPEVESYTIRRWRDSWVAYDGAGWVQWPDERIGDMVSLTLEHAVYTKVSKAGGVETKQHVPWAPSPQKVGGVIKQMETITRLDTEVDEGTWIGDADEHLSRPMVVANGLLDPATGELYGHTPRWFTLARTSVEYDPEALEPTTWLRVLRQQWPLVMGEPADEELLLQEWTGYVLSGRTDLQKALIMPGPERSSKGTFVWVLQQLVGKRQYIGLNAADFASPFGLQNLPGKQLAVIPDFRGGKGDHTLTSKLLEITGEDPIQIDRKNKNLWNGKVSARLMLLSNGEPQLTDASGVIVSRLLVARTRVSFLGREDTALKDKLADELPGILRWGVVGLQRLDRQGRFTEPTSAAETRELMKRGASPAAAFAEDYLAFGPATTSETRADVLNAWKCWTAHSGHEKGSAQTLLTALRSLHGEVKEARAHGKERRWYGLRLTEAGRVIAEKGRRGIDLDGGLYDDRGNVVSTAEYLAAAARARLARGEAS